ncbi:MAG TPA: haloacid dehalogenase type II [Rhodospirillaceae bacterium]|nr:haloacid dehalogenase type II [Rhodospirillaceae bacterium]
MPLSGLSVAVFDAYGTLFDLGRLLDCVRPTLGEDATRLGELWRRKQLEYSWLRSLMGRHADFWHVTGESLDFAMKSLGIRDPSLRSRLMEAYLTPTAFPEALAALTKIRDSGLRMAILSNGSPSMLISAAKSAKLDTLLDALLSVESVGIFKPHPSVYRLVEQRFACRPEQVAFMSSNSWDVAGAAAFGFRTVWINRQGQPLEALPASPLRELPDLSPLPALLAG